MKVSRIGFADLLRLRLELGGWDEVAESASAIGVRDLGNGEEKGIKSPQGNKETVKPPGDGEAKPPDYGEGRQHARFVLPVLREAAVGVGGGQWPGSHYPELPDDQVRLPEGEGLTNARCLPIAPWFRLQGLFRHSLGRMVPGGQVDMDRLVADFSRGKAIRKLPRLKQRSCTGRAVLLLDCSRESFPFQDDLKDVSRRLERERGTSSLKIIRIRPKVSPWSVRHRIPPGVPVLVLGTMGLYQQEGERLLADWRRLGRWLRERDQFGHALIPVPRRRWCPELTRVWKCFLWDSWHAIPSGGSQGPSKGETYAGSQPDALLAALSISARVTFPLAREMRLYLGKSLDVGTEYDAWQHRDCYDYATFYDFREGRRDVHLDRLKEKTDDIDAIREIVNRHHECCNGLRKLEVLFMGLKVQGAEGGQKEEISLRLWEIVLRLRHAEKNSYREEASGIPLWIDYLMEQLPGDLRSEPEVSEPLARAWAAACFWAGKENLTWPRGIDQVSGRDEWNRLHGTSRESRSWFLYEEAGGIRYSSHELNGGFLISQLMTNGNLISVAQGGRNLEISLVEADGFIPWEGNDLLLQSTGGEELGLLRLLRPQWASKWVRTRKGLSVETMVAQAKKPFVWGLISKGREAGQQLKRLKWEAPKPGQLGRWVSEDGKAVELDWDLEAMLPVEWKVGGQSEVPEWATRGGRDDIGRFAVWEHEGVAFRFRWIPPGEFLMGSPENEVGRYGDEGPQHEVRLTRGFWMLETPVTQEQWMTNGSRNPSRFEGAKRPVEQVSWDDCQSWLKALKARFSLVEARLPTEAEWEYACRAGQQLAYNNGKECTVPDGKDPALEEVGWYKKNSGSKTQEVGMKKANAWGLSDMHGNVWEWCQDFWRDRYLEGREENPKGPKGGSGRVLRGGSWYDVARYCRSACRSRFEPGSRSDDIGFRFVLQASSDKNSQGGARSGPVKGAPPGGEKAGQGRAKQGEG